MKNVTTVVFTHTRTRAGELHTVCLHTHTRTGELHVVCLHTHTRTRAGELCVVCLHTHTAWIATRRLFTHTRTGELHFVCLHTHTRTGKLHGLLTKVTQLDDAPVCSVYDWLPLLSVNFPLILTPNVTRVYGTNNCHNKTWV